MLLPGLLGLRLLLSICATLCATLLPLPAGRWQGRCLPARSMQRHLPVFRSHMHMTVLLLLHSLLASLPLTVPCHQLLPLLPPTRLLLLLLLSLLSSPGCVGRTGPPLSCPPLLRHCTCRQVASRQLPAGMPRLLLSLAHFPHRPPPTCAVPPACSRSRLLLFPPSRPRRGCRAA